MAINFNINKNKQFETTIDFIDLFGIISAKIKIDKDYTFNKAFFDKGLEKEVVKKELIEYLKNMKIPFLKKITYFSNPKNKYFIGKITILNKTIRVILSANFGLIGFYPIFWRTK